MNNHIRGILFDKLPGIAVIDVGGIGYKLSISMNTYEDLPNKDESVMLYTYLSIKNEEMNIFGFSTLKEKMLFGQLIGIPKIGPKTALSVFNTLSPEAFEQALMNSDSKRISTVKGISSKTADRIILELSGKLELSQPSVSGDAYDALVVLGFKPRNIEKAINDIIRDSGEDLSVEFIIKESLKRLR